MKTQFSVNFWLVLMLSICSLYPVWGTAMQSDLRVKIDVNSRTVNRGDIVYFSVIVFNDGPDAVSNVQLLHKLEGVTFQYRRANEFRDGTVEHTNGSVVCSIATIPAGGYTMFQYFVQVTASQGTKVINWVEVIGAGGADPDSTPNNGNRNEDDMASIDMDILGGGYAPVQTPTTTQPASVPTPAQPTAQPTSANPSVRTSKSSYLPSEKIVVTYSGLSGSKSDWIAVTRADLPANQFGQWFYTDGKINGQFEYNALGPGTYEARVYFNWPNGQFVVKASTRFTVEAQQVPTTPTTIPTPPVSTPTPPVSLPTSTSSVIANWASNAVEYRGKIGQRYTFVCPANGTPSSIWGTDIYTDDSSICGAGVHTGTISKETGGDVTIEMVAGQTAYQGTLRNGIQTIGYGGWHGSYVVVAGKTGKMGNVTQLTWGDQADKYRGQNGLRLTCNCPAGGDAARLWGTDVYTDDSSICLAAVHAGLITKVSGGQVVIEIKAGQASYTGSNRNGVQSAGYGGWSGSFIFVR